MSPTVSPPAAKQLTLDLPHRSAMGEADFLVAAPNAEAVAWIDRWPAWPAPALCLYGPAGCGKTHLSRIWAERAA
ncbi:MAG TPA: DNA replication protein, partial [Azospirillaceae bacterium]|nr:DNA replication protein [Azospirillaceae bacterium]